MGRLSRLFAALIALGGIVWFLMRDPRADTRARPQDTVERSATIVSPLDSSSKPTSDVASPLASPPTTSPRAGAAPSVGGADEKVPVRVRLVDDETHDPVPHLVAELRSSDVALERIESDDHGLLHSTGTFAPGPYRLDLASERAPNDLIQGKKKADASAFPQDVELTLSAHQPSDPVAEFAVPVGPTFQFVAGWPAGLSADAFSVQLSSADPRQGWDKLYARVHSGSSPWARFSPLARFLSGGPPWGLRVTSEDGLWLATATVENLDKRALAPVQLDFTARGRIVGRLLGPDAAPVVKHWVQGWLPDSSFENAAKRPVLVLTDAEGRFDLRALEPGRYTIRAEVDGFDPYAGAVDVPALTKVEHEVRLVAPDPATLGSIRGRITSRSGTYSGPVHVRLRPNFPPYAARVVDVVWKEEAAARQATFEFDKLVPGEYSIVAVPVELVPVLPRKVDTRPSSDLIELSIDDLGERVDVPLQVVADEDGAPLPGFRVDATIRGRETQGIAKAGKDETTSQIRGAPVGATLELVVYTHPDRQILWQDVVVTSPATPLVLRVKKGFGARILVRGPADEPLAGTQVFLDDELAGTTDEQGELRVARAKAPTVLRAEFRDWVLAPGGDVLPDTGKFRTEAPTVRVRMKPAK